MRALRCGVAVLLLIGVMAAPAAAVAAEGCRSRSRASARSAASRSTATRSPTTTCRSRSSPTAGSCRPSTCPIRAGRWPTSRPTLPISPATRETAITGADHRTLQQPHRQGPLHARQHGVLAGHQQQPEHPPRRLQRLPHQDLGGRAGPDAGFGRRRADVHVARRRGMTPGRTSKPACSTGFPGTVPITVVYSLDARNNLRIDYSATTDAPTVIDLTNHSYWDLGGVGSGTIYNDQFKLNADRYTPIDSTSIPTGALDPVAGTPMDFREFHSIGERVSANFRGYDHNWVINRVPGDSTSLVEAAELRDPVSGRTLTVSTDEPGIQFYSSQRQLGGARDPALPGFPQPTRVPLDGPAPRGDVQDHHGPRASGPMTSPVSTATSPAPSRRRLRSRSGLPPASARSRPARRRPTRPRCPPASPAPTATRR